MTDIMDNSNENTTDYETNLMQGVELILRIGKIMSGVLQNSKNTEGLLFF